MQLHKIIFASDLHGSNLVFKNLLDAAIQSNVGAVLIGGDITGKTLTPLIRRAGGVYEVEFKGDIRRATDGGELTHLQEDISNTGSYPIRVELDQYTELQHDKDLLKKRFLQEMKKRLEQWLVIAERRLKSKGIQFLIICGNDDDWDLDTIINASTFAQNPDIQVIQICNKEFEVIGECRANTTPFNCPRDVPDNELKNVLESKIQKLKNISRSIFMIHTPPFNSNLDMAPEVDEKIRPKFKAGSPVLHPAGSQSVRELIEKYQPLVSLHGHIHESHGHTHIGKTLCLNPGSEYSIGIMRSYVVTLNPDSVQGYMLLTR